MVFYFLFRKLYIVYLKYKCTGFIINLTFETTLTEVLKLNCKKTWSLACWVFFCLFVFIFKVLNLLVYKNV